MALKILEIAVFCPLLMIGLILIAALTAGALICIIAAVNERG
jgi:hypothetical protein